MRVIKNAANNDPAATLDSHLDCRALLIQIVALHYFWALARDDRPWDGDDPPGVAYCYAPGRSGSFGEEFELSIKVGDG